MRNTFDGETYDEERDRERLVHQLVAVRDLMLDGKWRTLGRIEQRLGYPQASISARLRDLRKAKFGAHTVKRRYKGNGLWTYRVVVDAPESEDG